MQDVLSTVISQYSSSPRICGLIDAWNAAIDPAPDIDAFFDDVWNIDTAVGYGLDVWGRIVGVDRIADTIVFSDTVYRNVIRAKAIANICNGSNHAINRVLIQLFGPTSPTPVVGNSYVGDDVNGSMQLIFGPPAQFTGSITLTTLTLPSPPAGTGIVLIGQQVLGAGVATGTTILAQTSGSPGLAGNYTVSISQTVGSEAMTSNSVLTDVQLAIINYSGVIPKPCGVGLTILD